METKEVKKIEKRYLYTIYFTVIMGFITHGFMMCNKISNHDDVDGLKESWNTFELGRWGMSIINKWCRVFLGSSVSVPWLIGIVSIVCITASAIVFINIFQIRNLYLCLAVGGILITFPAMTSTFTYVYIVAFFCMGIFFAFLGSYFAIKVKGWKGAAIAVLLLIASLSMYQTYIGIAAAVLILQLSKDAMQIDFDFKELFKKALYYLLILFLGMLGYICITKVSIALTGWQLKDYQNLRSMGEIQIWETIKGVAKIYLTVPRMIVSNLEGITATLLSRIFTAVIFILNLVFIFHIIRKQIADKKYLQAISFLGLMVLYPVAYNLVYIMGAGLVHTVMLYPTVMLFLQCIFFADIIIGENRISFKETNSKEEKRKVIYCVVLLFSIVQLFISYTHTANVTYLKMQLVKEEAQSYLTTLITQIKDLDGYNNDLKVTFVGKVNDKSLTNLDDQYGYLNITGVNNAYSVVTMRRHELYMKYYCGFQHEWVDIRNTQISPEVIAQMPNYPEKGSIQIIDDIIVVKFNEMK